MKVKVRMPPAASVDTALSRVLADVRTEMTRLVHAVDDVKKGGDVSHLHTVSLVLRSAYQLVDSYRLSPPPAQARK